jgi:hypothetical protein
MENPTRNLWVKLKVVGKFQRGLDLAEYIVLERLTANVEVATVLGSIPAPSDTVEYEGR